MRARRRATRRGRAPSAGTGSNGAAGLTLGGSTGTQTLSIVGSATDGAATLGLSNQGVSSDGVRARGRLILTTTETNSWAFLNVSGTLANAGTITVDPGAGNNGGRFLYGGYNNTATGTIAINETTQSQGGPWTNSNTITIANGKGLTGVGGPFTNTGTLTNGGTFEQAGGFTWTSGTITNNGSFTAANGTFTTGSGALSGNPILLVGDAISPNGTGSAAFVVHGSANSLDANVASGYSLTIEGSASHGAATLTYSADRTNNGTIHLTTTDTNSWAFLNAGSSILTNNNTITVDPGAGNNGGRFLYGGYNNTATGTIAINETTQTTGNPWTSSGALSIAALKTLMLSGGLTVSGGTLSGSGTIAGNVTQTGGTISPGSSPGKLTIDGNYTGGKSGKVRIELNGTAPGQFDVLAITGTAVLAGTLQLVTNYSPALGDSFTVITYASKTGKFKTISGQFLAGDIGYDVKVGATSTTLKVVKTVDLQTTKIDSADPPQLHGRHQGDLHRKPCRRRNRDDRHPRPRHRKCDRDERRQRCVGRPRLGPGHQQGDAKDEDRNLGSDLPREPPTPCGPAARTKRHRPRGRPSESPPRPRLRRARAPDRAAGARELIASDPARAGTVLTTAAAPSAPSYRTGRGNPRRCRRAAPSAPAGTRRRAS